MLWDIFCRVIDNFGDIGVCWRLSVDLAARGEQVRLWVDDASALEWMAPGAVRRETDGLYRGHHNGVTVLPWLHSTQARLLQDLPSADVWLEAFGCDISPELVAHFATCAQRVPVWINLEYLTAERYAERSHTLPSPVLHGPARGWVKHFFYPGFTAATGGLLREQDLVQRQSRFAALPARQAWLQSLGIYRNNPPILHEQLVSLFCYEPPALPRLLHTLAAGPQPTLLLVTAGRASQAVQHALGMPDQSVPVAPDNSTPAAPADFSGIQYGQVCIHYLPPLSQTDYDHLLWVCDINFVRGEDSLVRALWAGKPLVWQLYPQSDNAHLDKLHAFLQTTAASPEVRALHLLWNSPVAATMDPAPRKGQGALPPGSEPLADTPPAPVPLPALPAWQDAALALRQRLLQQTDLASALLQFVSKNR